MKNSVAFLLSLALTGLSVDARSLAMGPDEFVAARNLTCVLAQETLGYLTEEEYAEMVREVLDGYDEAESDVIRAKALGYYDGLMFDLPAHDERRIDDRLRRFLESRACTVYAAYRGVGLTL